MELINQHTKSIMEECKVRARDAGLQFDDETLEYIVTNKDLLELSPKVMIPTLYDYWLNDVEVIKNKAIYKVYPSNPYETVINSRPAISFYNDNNPDWLNIMIFYHVLAHIDFFQNNFLFQKTWNDDFVGQALADKRLIAGLRSEKGRWVDYVIEFSKSIDNLCGFLGKLMNHNYNSAFEPPEIVDYYFDTFLQEVLKVPQHKVFNEIQRYNQLYEQDPDVCDKLFFVDVKKEHPEFQALFNSFSSEEKKEQPDVMKYIHDNSPFLFKEENRWIKSIMNIIRNTALYFAPQMRSKIINEGWASYWHDELFRNDDRISGHEVAYAKINAYVTSVSRVGLNPYAIGLRLIQYVEEMANKGHMNYDFQKITNAEERKLYDNKSHNGKDVIFELRKKLSDFTLINTFTDQDFVDKNNLFVVGKRLNEQRRMYEYYIKSRKASDYKNMLIDSLYHPPHIHVDPEKTNDENLYLVHEFEGKQLHYDYIPETLIGIEFLWGGQVQLETTLIQKKKTTTPGSENGFDYIRVLYVMKDRKLHRRNLI